MSNYGPVIIELQNELFMLQLSDGSLSDFVVDRITYARSNPDELLSVLIAELGVRDKLSDAANFSVKSLYQAAIKHELIQMKEIKEASKAQIVEMTKQQMLKEFPEISREQRQQIMKAQTSSEVVEMVRPLYQARQPSKT